MRPRHLAALAGALALGGCSPYSDSEQQARLAGRLDDYAETLSATENEAKQSLLARQQLAFLEQDVFGVNFVAWHGRIEAIDETDGRYALTLWVEDHVKLRTWRGASSDDSANPTKFAPDSPLAPALAELEPCDIVRVSGTVLTESASTAARATATGMGGPSPRR